MSNRLLNKTGLEMCTILANSRAVGAPIRVAWQLSLRSISKSSQNLYKKFLFKPLTLIFLKQSESSGHLHLNVHHPQSLLPEDLEGHRLTPIFISGSTTCSLDARLHSHASLAGPETLASIKIIASFTQELTIVRKNSSQNGIRRG
jgi:hypothetical protein